METATVRDDPAESCPYGRIKAIRPPVKAVATVTANGADHGDALRPDFDAAGALRLLLDLRAVHEFRLWRKALFQVFAVFLTLTQNLLLSYRICCETTGPFRCASCSSRWI